MTQLDRMVDNHWSEISTGLDTITSLANDHDDGEGAKYAAMLASKVYFHLGDYPQAVK